MKSHPAARLRKGLNKYFGRCTTRFLDITLLCVNTIAIDITAFDDFLHIKHSDYADNESMKDFITRKYGKVACDFISNWIQGEKLP